MPSIQKKKMYILHLTSETEKTSIFIFEMQFLCFHLVFFFLFVFFFRKIYYKAEFSETRICRSAPNEDKRSFSHVLLQRHYLQFGGRIFSRTRNETLVDNDD